MQSPLLTVGSYKISSTGERKARIRIIGNWLYNFGFEADSVVRVEFKQGLITLKLEGKGMETYNRICKDVLQKGHKIVYVKMQSANKKRVPHIELKGSCIEDVGFKINDVLVKRIEHGLISLCHFEFIPPTIQ